MRFEDAGQQTHQTHQDGFHSTQPLTHAQHAQPSALRNHKSQVLVNTFQPDANTVSASVEAPVLRSNILDASMQSSSQNYAAVGQQPLRNRSSNSRSPNGPRPRATAKASLLRDKSSKASIERLAGLPPQMPSNKPVSSYHHVSTKQVTFDHDSRDNLPTCPSTQSLSDIVVLDAFYQDLLAKERAQFERILKSRCNLARNKVTTRLQKQIDQAGEKYEQVASLEKRLKLTKDSYSRLQAELQACRSQQFQAEARCKVLEQERVDLKAQLDRLWGRTEHEKEIAMVITR